MSEQHYIYKIETDYTPESPREFDNLGTMACWHRRYSLGDVQPKCGVQDHLAELIGWDDDKQQAVYDYWFGHGTGTAKELNYHASRKLKERIKEEFDKQFIGLELYLWDHSGLSMSSGPFEYPCGLPVFGIIYVAKDKIRQEYGIKHVSKAWEEKIRGYLDQEVKTFDEFLTGQVYGYRIFEVPEGVDPEELSEDEMEEVDSLWGIYGEDYAEQEAKIATAYFGEHYAELMLKRQQAEFREAGQLELAV